MSDIKNTQKLHRLTLWYGVEEGSGKIKRQLGTLHLENKRVTINSEREIHFSADDLLSLVLVVHKEREKENKKNIERIHLPPVKDVFEVLSGLFMS